MPRGADKDQLNVTVPKRVSLIIDERAKALRWTRSAYGLAVFEWWESKGCPAVSPQDQAMILAAQMAKTKTKPHA